MSSNVDYSYKAVDPERYKAMGNQPDDPKKDHPEFDFSRVDQERLQNEDAARAGTPPPPDLNAKLELAEEKPPKAVKPSSISRPESRYLVSTTGEKKRKLFLQAGGIFVIFSILIPALLMGSFLTIVHFEKKADEEKKQAVSQKLKQSEVLQTFQNANSPKKNTSKPKKAIGMGFGTLLIRTTPTGANVFFNGSPLTQKTPVKITRVPSRQPLRIKASKTGYQEELRMLNIEPKENRELNIHLDSSRP